MKEDAAYRAFKKKMDNKKPDETNFRATVVTPWLKSQDIWYANQSSMYASRGGIPDVLSVTLGFGIELKKEKRFERRKDWPRQKDELRQINKEGGFGWLAYPENWERTKKYILQLKATGKPF